MSKHPPIEANNTASTTRSLSNTCVQLLVEIMARDRLNTLRMEDAQNEPAQSLAVKKRLEKVEAKLKKTLSLMVTSPPPTTQIACQ